MGGGSIRESWWFWWPSVTFKGGTQGGHFFSWISILNNVCIVWRRTIKFGRITCGGISRVSYIRPYCKRRGGAKRRPILGLPFYFAHSLLRRSTEFDVVIYMGRGACFYVVSHTPYLKVAGSQRSPILGFLSISAYTLCRRTTKFDVVAHVGRGVMGSATPPIPSERIEFQHSPSLGFSCIYAYTL